MSKYIITGAGFGNKGAESMLYTVITELKKRNPENCITVLCGHGIEKINPEDFDNITIVEESKRARKILLNPLRYIFYKTKQAICSKFNISCKKYRVVNEYLNCDIILDISGYALSSQWGKTPNKRMIDIIKIAKKYKKQIYFLPQSFGPFNFAKGKKEVIKYLAKADKIFCREKDGYDLLQAIGLQNIVLSSDIVLESNKKYEGIYKTLKTKDTTTYFNNNNRKALIIPNARVFERADNEKLYNTYKEIINALIHKDYMVYISYYDLSDIKICHTIKSMFNSDKVVLLEDYFNCIEFSDILPNFDFIISSRFHSIVHAYKQLIPCLVIGWAVKYAELTDNLGQKAYMFDARTELDNQSILSKLDELIENLNTEKNTIKSRLEIIQQNSCFNRLWEYLENE